MKKKIFVGLSGGVDSAAAALLLQREGYDVYGVTLRLKADAEADIRDAQCVAQALGIPHTVLPLEVEFRALVVDYFTRAYLSGETPNPCVICNPAIKFGKMLSFALENGAQAIATGHYARIEWTEGRFLLKSSPSKKDQSYFLHRLTQHQLAHAVFPLGDMTDKAEIRALAQAVNLPIAQKTDSQEICFVPQDDYYAFLERSGASLPPPGDFTDTDGTFLGRHGGIARYTVGQRKGLGAFGRPMYVTKINPADNTVVLGGEGAQYRTECTVRDLHWIVPPAQAVLYTTVKVRYRAAPQAVRVTLLENGCARLDFTEPVRAAAPGQFAVFYDGETVLGGGAIG